MVTLIAIIIAIIGAFNWLSIGIFDFNFVSWIFGANLVIVSRIIYTLVGIAGIWLLGYIIKCGRRIINTEKKSHSNE